MYISTSNWRLSVMKRGTMSKTIRKTIVGAFTAGVLLTGSYGPAFAEPPGPGDKQCVPGQSGNPHPGAKPPKSCPGPQHLP